MPEDTTTWYEYQVSTVGADDWFATNYKADTVAGLKRTFGAPETAPQGFEYRIVRKTLTVDVVKPVLGAALIPFTGLEDARTFARSAAGPVSVIVIQPKHPTNPELYAYRIGRTFWHAYDTLTYFEEAIEPTFRAL